MTSTHIVGTKCSLSVPPIRYFVFKVWNYLSLELKNVMFRKDSYSQCFKDEAMALKDHIYHSKLHQAVPVNLTVLNVGVYEYKISLIGEFCDCACTSLTAEFWWKPWVSHVFKLHQHLLCHMVRLDKNSEEISQIWYKCKGQQHLNAHRDTRKLWAQQSLIIEKILEGETLYWYSVRVAW